MSELGQRFNTIGRAEDSQPSAVVLSVSLLRPVAGPNHFHSLLLSDDLSHSNRGGASVKLLEEADLLQQTHADTRTHAHT